MKVNLRKYVGAIILLATICIVGFSGYINTMFSGKTYIIPFAHGEHMSDDGSNTIAEIAAALKSHNQFSAKINGYTETGGDNDANIELSTKRAEIVKGLLVAAGVNETQLITNGLGGTNPLKKQDGETDNAWEHRNARVEVILGK